MYVNVDFDVVYEWCKILPTYYQKYSTPNIITIPWPHFYVFYLCIKIRLHVFFLTNSIYLVSFCIKLWSLHNKKSTFKGDLSPLIWYE